MKNPKSYGELRLPTPTPEEQAEAARLAHAEYLRARSEARTGRLLALTMLALLALGESGINLLAEVLS